MIRTSRLSIAIQALEDVVDPIGKIKREMPRGYKLDGRYAVDIADSAGYLKEIAQQASNLRVSAIERKIQHLGESK